MVEMTRDEIREKLKIGGGWIGAARNWLLWHKDPNGRLTWGSHDPVEMNVREIEELAKEVAAAAIQESDRVTGQRRKLIDILIKLTPLVGVYMGAQGLVNFGHDSVGVPTALIEGVADGIRDLKILIYGKNAEVFTDLNCVAGDTEQQTGRSKRDSKNEPETDA